VGERERLAFSYLRRGDVLGALAITGGEAAGPQSLKLAALAAEAHVCLGRGSLDELEHLRDEIVAAGGDDTLMLRVDAALAEHDEARGDPACETIAARALRSFADQPILDAERLWARGRLFRTRALFATHEPVGEPSVPIGLLERAMADFNRAGFDAEAARSAAEVHVACCVAYSDGFVPARDIVVECLARSRELGSSYVDLVLGCRVVLDLAVGDLVAMHAGADEIEAMVEVRPLHPVARITASSVRVLSRVIGEGPTPAVLQAIEDHLHLVRTEMMTLTSSQLVGLASALVDSGHIEPQHLALARRWVTQATAGWPRTRRFAEDLTAMVARLDLLERGDDPAVAAVEADLARSRRPGQHRVVAQRALLAALAARGAGRDDVAERLYLDAMADLGPPERRTLWESALVARVVAARSTGPTAPKLRLLGPEVTTEIGAARRTLSPSLARLVVALAAEGGAAPVDRLIDVLWPDADLSTGRSRLRLTLHRLRRALRDDIDPLQRRGEIVALAPSVDLDTTRFEKLAAGNLDDRRRAVEVYGGAVAWGQLAYDDVAVPLRRRLAGLWLGVSSRALADPALPRATVAHIATVARRDAATDPEFADLYSAAERRLR
jgi:hypothetical protein